MSGVVHFQVYARGLCAISVCTTLTDKAMVEEHANRVEPTGIESQWSVTEPRFRTGQTNPCPCDAPNSNAVHWLLTC